MKKHDKATVRAYGHIQKRIEEVPAILERLSAAAELLASYGWFDEDKVERFSRWEQFDLLGKAIGEAAEIWGVSATERVVRVLDERQAPLIWGWDYNVPELLERWLEGKSSEDYQY